MPRLIKRYESRKLYDTEESRYVSLEELGEWVRAGAELRVIDSLTSADVTAQTLIHVLLDEERRGAAIASELLHELLRLGDRGGLSEAERLSALRQLAPARRARAQLLQLRDRLQAEAAALDWAAAAPGAAKERAPRRRQAAATPKEPPKRKRRKRK